MDELIILAADNGYLRVMYDDFNNNFIFEISRSDDMQGKKAVVPYDRVVEIVDFMTQYVENGE